MRFALPLLLPAALLAQVPTPEGHWEGAITTPQGDLGLQIDLWKEDGALRGAIAIPSQGLKQLALGDPKVEGGRLRFTLPAVPGQPGFDGAFAEGGARVEGTFTQGGRSFPFALKRQGEPSLLVMAGMKAEAPQPLPGEREVTFEGFNRAPLRASVAPGGAHPYFAVMVAGSGPTNRDWSNPLLGRPSHSGREVARWLQAQGIGSLRYDKRFIGAKDAHLDLSLDAQAGDVKAALAYARTLPEAKGKKLLLLGHSEGALLSLVAGEGADALLLLGLPEKSLGGILRAQVARQLDQAQAPDEARRANLGHLDRAFEAIRTRKALPEAEPGVAPGVVALVKGLAAPASLDFVRQTLDLDPWPLLARTPQPVLLVWGDRDIQTPAPQELPKGLRADHLRLPFANHVLRREDRDAKGLHTGNAGERYGDDTPLADLSPLLPWLKALR